MWQYANMPMYCETLNENWHNGKLLIILLQEQEFQ